MVVLPGELSEEYLLSDCFSRAEHGIWGTLNKCIQISKLQDWCRNAVDSWDWYRNFSFGIGKFNFFLLFLFIGCCLIFVELDKYS